MHRKTKLGQNNSMLVTMETQKAVTGKQCKCGLFFAVEIKLLEDFFCTVWQQSIPKSVLNPS